MTTPSSTLATTAMTVLGSLAGTSLVIGMSAASIAQAEQPASIGPNHEDNHVAAVAQSDTVLSSATVKADASEGKFSWNQTTVTANASIARTFSVASKALCGSTSDPIVNENPLGWQLAVTGDVNCEYVISIDELAQEDSVTQMMSCTCAGNPADGIAIAFAQTQGIPVSYIVERAGAVGNANTITFISADGTEATMPLAYAIGHHAVISYAVNGEDLSASMGGNNQLWMKGTPANFFVRDIVEVRVTAESEVPPAPGEDMDHPNSPNVGVIASTVS